MELRHLRYFAAVAERLSFGRAAQYLHVSQPTLTRQIQALEEEVGLRLLERDGRRPMALTAAGRSLLADAQEIIARVGMVRARAHTAARSQHERLNVATVAALSNTFLPGCLRAFRKALPQVEVCLFEMERAEQLLALREGRVQVAVFPSLGDELEPGLAEHPVLTCPMLAVLPDEHPAAGKRQATDEEGVDIRILATEVLVIPSPESSPGYLERFNRICAVTGFRAGSLLPVEGADNVLRMVAAGFGMAILPEVAVHGPVAMCVTRKLRAPVPPFELKLLWRKENLSEVLQQFLTLAGHHRAGLEGESHDPERRSRQGR